MMKRVIVLLLLVAVALAVVACGGTDSGTTNGSSTGGGPAVTPGGTDNGTTPVADGATLMEERCTVCHSTSRILEASKDLAGWQATIDRMVGKGAELTTEEQAVLAEYLAGL